MSTYKVYGGVPTMETEKLQNLLDTAEGGASGSGLPEVTADDNGKVLTVVDGEWDKAEASGGGGVLVVHGSLDEQSESVVLDKTWQEINDADFAVLKIPVLGESITDIYHVSSCVFERGSYDVFFSKVGADDYAFSSESPDGYPSVSLA